MHHIINKMNDYESMNQTHLECPQDLTQFSTHHFYDLCPCMWAEKNHWEEENCSQLLLTSFCTHSPAVSDSCWNFMLHWPTVHLHKVELDFVTYCSQTISTIPHQESKSHLHFCCLKSPASTTSVWFVTANHCQCECLLITSNCKTCCCDAWVIFIGLHGLLTLRPSKM